LFAIKRKSSGSNFSLSQVCSVCVICGHFGCKKGKIDKQSREAQFQAQPQSCAQRRTGADTRSGIGSSHSADALGEIRFCDFPVADLSCPGVYDRHDPRLGCALTDRSTSRDNRCRDAPSAYHMDFAA